MKTNTSSVQEDYDYISWYVEWFWYIESIKNEIKLVLQEQIDSKKWIWIFSSQTLKYILSNIDKEDIFYFYWVAQFLATNFLLDAYYPDCILCFIEYENLISSDNELKIKIKNNSKLLDKLSENIRIRILSLLD